jgi:hypothetical protein
LSSFRVRAQTNVTIGISAGVGVSIEKSIDKSVFPIAGI